MQLPTTLRSGPHPAPRVGMRVGGNLLPAVPVHLDGHRASLRFEDCPLETEWAQSPSMPAGHTHLQLDWADGSVTELVVQVRSLDVPAQVAHVDIHGVNENWRPFMEYLAGSA